jgi:hypothetical protein
MWIFKKKIKRIDGNFTIVTLNHFSALYIPPFYMRSLNLGLDMYYFVKSNARSNNRYKQDKIIRMLYFFYQQLICPYFSFICVVLFLVYNAACVSGFTILGFPFGFL